MAAAWIGRVAKLYQVALDMCTYSLYRTFLMRWFIVRVVMQQRWHPKRVLEIRERERECRIQYHAMAATTRWETSLWDDDEDDDIIVITNHRHHQSSYYTSTSSLLLLQQQLQQLLQVLTASTSFIATTVQLQVINKMVEDHNKKDVVTNRKCKNWRDN